MSHQTPNVTEYTVRVPKNSKKRYNVMRFHNASGVDFKNWSNVKMERENNYKEFKSLEDDLPKFGAGSEFGREQRDEARRKRYGINIKKYRPDDQPWLLSIKEKNLPTLTASQNGANSSSEKKFKGIREGGVSDNVSWYVFLNAKDGAFEAYPIEEWYNFQPINRYKALSAEEAERQFERRDKIVNLFSLKKLRNEEEDQDAEEGMPKKPTKSLVLSEIDDWISDSNSEEDAEEKGSDTEVKLKKKQPPIKRSKKTKQGGKRKKTEDGGSGTDCEEESDEFDEGAEHEYIDEDSSDPDDIDEDKATRDLAGVDENKGLRKMLDSDDEDEEKKDEEKKDDDIKQEKESSDEEKKLKKKKVESSTDSDDSSEDEKTKSPKTEKEVSNAEILKRKIAENPDSVLQPSKRARSDAPALSVPSDTAAFEDQIKRYLARKPMTTTDILHKLKSKKTGRPSKELVDIITVVLKKINPTRQMVKGKMYLSVK